MLVDLLILQLKNIVVLSFIVMSSSGLIQETCIGDILTGQIKQVVESNQAIVLATRMGLGRVDITDISDHYVDNPLKTFSGYIGKYLRYVTCTHTHICTHTYTP